MYIKIFEEKVPKKVGECIYLTVKNARASRTLRWALDPSQYWLALLTQLCFTTSAKSRGPPPLSAELSCYING